MAADFPYANLLPWLDSLAPERPEEMRKMEAHAAEHGFPIIGPAAGHLCYLFAKMCGARTVFELGSGYGYSTAWFAKAVDENGGGEVCHVVWDENLSAMARKHLAALGYPAHEDDPAARTTIRYVVGEAVEALTRHTGPFDLIFNDIDKEGYPAAIPVVEPRLRPGGVFITDNVVWSGKTFDKSVSDSTTEAIRDFVHKMTTNPAWSAGVVPVRDGLLVAVKR